MMGRFMTGRSMTGGAQLTPLTDAVDGPRSRASEARILVLSLGLVSVLAGSFALASGWFGAQPLGAGTGLQQAARPLAQDQGEAPARMQGLSTAGATTTGLVKAFQPASGQRTTHDLGR